jgi:hypothetical protein
MCLFSANNGNKGIDITYMIPRNNGEVVLGGTYVSIVTYLFFGFVFVEPAICRASTLY